MVMVLVTRLADTPAGKPLAPDIPSLLMPVAPVAVCVMLVSAELIHTVGVDDAAPVLFSETVIVPVAFTVPQPPVKGIV